MTAPPTIDRLRSLVADAPRTVNAIYLFGSFARGTARPSSDVDLAVLFNAPPRTIEELLFDYQDRLQEVLGCAVQFVILNDAPPDLTHRVLRDGTLLLERDRAARIAFEVRTRNMYFDLLPVLTAYRERVLARAAHRG